MKYIYILTLFILFASTNLYSQSYTLIPGDSIEVYGIMEDLHTLTIDIQNTTSGQLTIGWEKVSEIVPTAWDAAVCDNAICYGNLVTSGTMTPVGPGVNAYLLLHVTPHVNFGTSIIQYAVWDINNFAIKDTLTFILHVVQPTGVDEFGITKLNIYPNPATDYIILSGNIKENELYTITAGDGKLVSKGIINSAAIPLIGLRNGFYILSLPKFNSKIKFTVNN